MASADLPDAVGPRIATRGAAGEAEACDVAARGCADLISASTFIFMFIFKDIMSKKRAVANKQVDQKQQSQQKRTENLRAAGLHGRLKSRVIGSIPGNRTR